MNTYMKNLAQSGGDLGQVYTHTLQTALVPSTMDPVLILTFLHQTLPPLQQC